MIQIHISGGYIKDIVGMTFVSRCNSGEVILSLLVGVFIVDLRWIVIGVETKTLVDCVLTFEVCGSKTFRAENVVHLFQGKTLSFRNLMLMRSEYEY